MFPNARIAVLFLGDRGRLYFYSDNGVIRRDPERNVELLVTFGFTRQAQLHRLQGGSRRGDDRDIQADLPAVGGRNDERPFEPDKSPVGKFRIIRRCECRRHRGRSAASAGIHAQARVVGREFDAADLVEHGLRFG